MRRQALRTILRHCTGTCQASVSAIACELRLQAALSDAPGLPPLSQSGRVERVTAPGAQDRPVDVSSIAEETPMVIGGGLVLVVLIVVVVLVLRVIDDK
jgi:hypothetical protein